MADSSPTPEQIEVAEVLTGKAAGDLRVLEKIAPDPEILDDSVGFNAQQAVEKALKAALTLSAVDFPKPTISTSSSGWPAETRSTFSTR